MWTAMASFLSSVVLLMQQTFIRGSHNVEGIADGMP